MLCSLSVKFFRVRDRCVFIRFPFPARTGRPLVKDLLLRSETPNGGVTVEKFIELRRESGKKRMRFEETGKGIESLHVMLPFCEILSSAGQVCVHTISFPCKDWTPPRGAVLLEFWQLLAFYWQ